MLNITMPLLGSAWVLLFVASLNDKIQPIHAFTTTTPPRISSSFSSGKNSMMNHHHQKMNEGRNFRSIANSRRGGRIMMVPNNNKNEKEKKVIQDEYDVIVVGSGIGGLSCAAMLTLYGYSVAVFESHYAPGGCAHGYSVPASQEKDGVGVEGAYHFDTGPSFFSGLNPDVPSKISNPLRTILDAVGETVECIPYDTFGLQFPEGSFLHTTSFGSKGGVLEQVSGTKAVAQWKTMMKKMEPLAAAVDALPTAALRADLGVARTAAPFLKNFAKLNPLENLKLTKPFGTILDDAGVNDQFARNWLDLLCFCLSGLPASGTITAEMAMMMGEFYEPGCTMDCPKGGAKAIVDSLVRAIEKRGGQLFVNSHVSQINVDEGAKRITGITLKKKNRVVRAKKAVVSNLSIWDLLNSGIINNDALPEKFVTERKETPVGKSFMHLHIGFEATKEELEKLQAHYMYVDSWEKGIEAEDNAVLVSIPSVHDDSLAPTGRAVLHAYTPATESYDRWENVDRNSEEYRVLKEQRSEYLWTALDNVLPKGFDIRERAKIINVGTPLTHKRFLNRYKGSYGPAIIAGEQSFPFPNTPLNGLLLTGDSCFPGIGVPAVAGSGLLTANSVSFDSIRPQLKVLDTLVEKMEAAKK